MKSKEFLQAAIDVQKERGAQYDKPSGERSMGATVAAFNCITGNNLKEQDGWMLLGLLKLVRQSQNPEKYHHDSALDFVAYASLYAEAASEQCKPVEDVDSICSAGWWSIAPDNAEWAAQSADGDWWWYEVKPKPDEDRWYNDGDLTAGQYFACKDSPNENFKSTLQRRPQQ